MTARSSIRIAHLTSAHPRGDTRIFVKQCRSLAGAGYDVSLFVADGLGDAEQDEVTIIDVGKPSGRLDRMRNTSAKILQRMQDQDFSIVHLHDPELIPAGLQLERMGKRVIFDAHEDLPQQIMGKHYLNRPLRIILSKLFAWYEKRACRKFDAIVAATPFIRSKFEKINATTVDVNNYPIIDELESAADVSPASNTVCYLGGIAAIRGIEEMVKAMELVDRDASLLLGGAFDGSDIETRVRSYPGWSRVEFLGWLDREGVRDVLGRSRAGLVTLHPLVNYLDSLPVKMFEYMAAGLPVIASNFPLWQKIIGDNDCGICVNPLEPREIAAAIDRLLGNPEESRRMGENGLRAVREMYNWSLEEKKLLALYDEILSA